MNDTLTTEPRRYTKMAPLSIQLIIILYCLIGQELQHDKDEVKKVVVKVRSTTLRAGVAEGVGEEERRSSEGSSTTERSHITSSPLTSLP